MVDTNVLIDYDRGGEDNSVRDWWEEAIQDGYDIYVSAVSLLERMSGIVGERDERVRILQERQKRLKDMIRYGKIAKILHVSPTIWRGASRLLQDYCVRYTPPSNKRRMQALILDMLILATSKNHRLILITQDKHLANIAEESGICVEDPFQGVREY